jgi:hypothetical protein
MINPKIDIRHGSVIEKKKKKRKLAIDTRKSQQRKRQPAKKTRYQIIEPLQEPSSTQ